MLDSGTIIVLITVVAAGICVLSLYSIYGNVIRHETTLHDLRTRVEQLQNNQILHLAELKGEIAPEPVLEAVELSDVSDQQDEHLEIDPLQSIEQPISSSTNAA